MCRGVDWDELLAYSTVKIVQVRDWRLGALRYLSVLVILIYIVGIVVLSDKLYLQVETPTGVTYATFELPTYRNASAFSKLRYCSQVKQNYTPCVFQYNCALWDAYQTLFPADTFGDLFVTTRVASSFQTAAGCDTAECIYPPINKAARKFIYVSEAEAGTIWIRHNMQAPLHGMQMSSSEMSGQLVDSTVAELLAASHTGLDEPSDTAAAAPGQCPESRRSAGLILLVTINYNNVDHNPIMYTYSVLRVANAEYKARHVCVARVFTFAQITENLRINATTRVINDRHGVKIVFLVGGKIGSFSFQNLLVSLVSGMGLMATGTIIVDVVMLYFLPHRALYRLFKYEVTEKGKDIRDTEDVLREHFRGEGVTAAGKQPTTTSGVSLDRLDGQGGGFQQSDRDASDDTAPSPRTGRSASLGATPVGATVATTKTPSKSKGNTTTTTAAATVAVSVDPSRDALALPAERDRSPAGNVRRYKEKDKLMSDTLATSRSWSTFSAVPKAERYKPLRADDLASDRESVNEEEQQAHLSKSLDQLLGAGPLKTVGDR